MSAPAPPPPEMSGVSGGETALSVSPMVATWIELPVGECGDERGYEEVGTVVQDLRRVRALSKLL